MTVAKQARLAKAHAAKCQIGKVHIYSLECVEAERRATITACLERVEAERMELCAKGQELEDEGKFAEAETYWIAARTCSRIATRLKQLEEQK